MKSKHIISFFLLSIILISCNKKSNSSNEERTLFAPTKDTIIAKFRNTPQKFTIDGTRDTIIKGESGIKIAIGANVFVDEHGNPVSNIKLELLEAINVQSFIENNLITISDDEILESGGMFYINATSNGQAVNIKNDEALTLSVPSSSIMGNMNMFYGKYNDEGKLDWKIVENKETMELDFNMTAIPLNLLDYKGQSKRLKDNFLFGNPIIIEEIEKLSDPKYEGTFIATREFSERLQIHLMGSFTDPDKNTFRDVMDIYKKHINGNLWEADEEVFIYLTPHYNDLMKRMNSDKKDDELGIAKGFKEFGNVCWNILKSYPQAKYTRPIDFHKLGITENTSKKDLIEKGISPAQADRFLYMYNTYKSETTFENIKAYTVSVSKLGWVNIDRFLDDPSCKESKLSVIVKGIDSNTVKLMLVFPLRNICVEAINNNGNKYSFTNKSGMYRKLPIGEEAVIIALSSKNGQPYFGTTKIQIPETGEFTLEVFESTTEDIKSSMSKVLKAKSPGL
jgi:hypothetical protein